MNLEPSKLSKQADQVWNESTRLFQAKKPDPGSIGFGFSKFSATKSGGDTATANGGDKAQDKEKAQLGGVNVTATQLPTTSNITNSGIGGSLFSSGYVFGSRLAERLVTKGGDGEREQLTMQELSGGGRPKDVSSIFENFKLAAASGTPGNTSNLWKVQTSEANAKLHDPTNASGNDAGPTATLPPTGSVSHAPPSNSSTLQASIEAMEKKQQSGIATGSEGTAEPITTGEEEERNLLNINCKFYHFDRDSKNWVERGLGTLRVNQGRGGAVRVIGRSSGNQKILINSKVWSEMILEEVSEKRLKISAQNSDSPIPQLFIVQANPSHVVNLCALLEKHIALTHESINSKPTSRKRKASNKTRLNCVDEEADGQEREDEEGDEQDSSGEVDPKRPVADCEQEEEQEEDGEEGSSDE